MEVDSLTQLPRLWFPGGTVVFRAQNTIYRVFPDPLSSCSPVFQSMFGIPQPSSQEKYEDLPLINMSETADELTALFEAIYNPQYSQIFMPHTTQDDASLELILAILKLSTKYQIDYLRFQSLRLLNADFVPLSLEEFLSPPGSRKFIMPYAAMGAIPAVRQNNAAWLLPSLYYIASGLNRGVWHDFDGLDKAGLSRLEERLILRGRAQLMHVNNDQICAPLRGLCAESNADCDHARLDLLSRWGDTDPLARVDDWGDEDICESCSVNVIHDMGLKQSQVCVANTEKLLHNLERRLNRQIKYNDLDV